MLTLEDFPQPALARCLSPNGRAHYMAVAYAKRAVRDLVAIAALRAGLERMHKVSGVVTIRPVFVYPVQRQRDDDNLATGVMKAVRDALVKGTWLRADDTDHLKQMPVEVRVEKGRRALKLTFEWAGAGSSSDRATEYERIYGDEERWDRAADLKQPSGVQPTSARAPGLPNGVGDSDV